MSTIIIIFVIWKIVKFLTKKSAPRQSTQQKLKSPFCEFQTTKKTKVVSYQPNPLTKAEMDRLRREEQRRIKELQAAEQAADELERIQALRQQYIDLLANLEQERNEAATQSKKNALTEKILSIEGKMIRIDSRMAKLYSTANQIICIG